MADLKVSLPAPCSESWDGMSPRGCNRHCAACDTVIHDLSLMTVDEAEALLDSGHEVCVKASVRRDGSVRMAPSRTSKSRRMVATIGASLSLATAACQTPQISPRYEVSGQIKAGYSSRAELESETGKTYKSQIRGDKFRFTNLQPGTYTLSFSNGCGDDVQKFQTITVSDDLNLGEVDLSELEMCIIVGKLMRADEKSDG